MSLLLLFQPQVGTHIASFTATYQTNSTLNKSTTKNPFAASYVAQGTIVRQVQRVFSAVFSDTGSVTAALRGLHVVTLSAAYVTSGLFTKRATHYSFSATYKTIGALAKNLNRKLTSSSFSTNGVLASVHQRYKSLTATFSTSGNITNQVVGKLLNAEYSTGGSLVKLTTRTLRATYKGLGYWIRSMKPHWTPIKSVVSGGSRSETVTGGDRATNISSGDIIETVSTGSDNETITSN